MTMSTDIGDLTAGLRSAARFGLFDPWLSSARFMGAIQWGFGIGSMVAASALRFPTRPAIIDDDTTIDYRTLDCRATNMAGYLRREANRRTVGILCRNHHGFLVGQVATERAGLDLVLMSTALPAPKLAEVLAREDVGVLIADEEFAPLIADAGLDITIVWATGDGPNSLAVLADVRRMVVNPTRRSRLVLLTSGTTGPPKGARRSNRTPRLADTGLLGQLPYRVGDLTLVSPPLFHAWGLSQATVALATGSTLMLRRKFDAAQVVSIMADHELDVLAVVPLMLRRILAEVTPKSGCNQPRIVASSGNVLSGALALEWMDQFGDRLFNLYGSTEAAIGTIAGPVDLREAPGTVGRPPRGVTLTILDDDGMPVAVGDSGRVFLSSSMQFTGYTDGSDGDRSGTLLATGDLGHVDVNGLLHIRGRANDMIVTGGENVFPSRVEEVLDTHPDVEMSAVVGVDDDEYGQRVVAFVVPRLDKDGKGRVELDIDELRRTAAADLQSFMVPKEVVIVDALPMTTTGKVIRHRLAVLGDADRV